MKLEVKHLAAYLPYGLTFLMESEPNSKEPNIDELKSIDASIKMVNFGWVNAKTLTEIKPILRPLSMLDEEIEYKGEKFIPIQWLEDKYYTLSLHKECERLLELDGHQWINHLSYLLLIHLFEWHFDVFGLIPNNLATEMS